MTNHPAFPDDPLGMALFAELLDELDGEEGDDDEGDDDAEQDGEGWTER
jgi:hypothetical protein